MTVLPFIVLVDDNPSDIQLVKMAFEQRGIPARFQVCLSGKDAFYLFRTLAHEPTLGIPDLLVLDLNMPAFNGLQLLAYIRSQELLKNLKVAMLSCTGRAIDQARARELGVTVYLIKPMVLADYGDLIGQLQTFINSDRPSPENGDFNAGGLALVDPPAE